MPFRILIIDDKIDNKTNTISGLPALLQAAGYEVTTTADGVAVS
jgi:CheY-like chemotaxis protein